MGLFILMVFLLNLGGVLRKNAEIVKNEIDYVIWKGFKEKDAYLKRII